jgi:prepilin-type N-terminal cleavage/methylation domain-containing protein
MKLRWQKLRNRALTLPELLVVMAILLFLAFFILPAYISDDRPYSRMACVSNLKQVNLSFRIWEGDNNNKYPMAVSVTNGGAMEQIVMGDVVDCYRVMSNELSTPRILICPEDTVHTIEATNFDNDFNASRISYFVGVDVTNEMNPAMLLVGDDNFQINGNLVGSGVLSLSTNTPMEWGPGRHGDAHRHFWTPRPKHFVGNLGFADGSVAEVSDSGLQGALQQTGLATNRLAIP